MNEHDEEFAEQLTRVRPETRNLIESVLMDAWPNHAAVVDFGLDSQEHYEALYDPLRAGQITPLALDAALGHGEKLTALVREAPSNPHRDVEFYTSWDVMFGRDRPQPSGGAARETEARTGEFELRQDERHSMGRKPPNHGTYEIWYEGKTLAVAVQGTNVRDVERLTSRPPARWRDHPAVKLHVEAPRRTKLGDVIVDPTCGAWEVQEDCYMAVDPPEPVAERMRREGIVPQHIQLLRGWIGHVREALTGEEITFATEQPRGPVKSGDRAAGHEDHLAHDAIEGAMTRLESFADAFERLSSTREQLALAAEFQAFVGRVAGPMSGRDPAPAPGGGAREAAQPQAGAEPGSVLGERLRDVSRSAQRERDRDADLER